VCVLCCPAEERSSLDLRQQGNTAFKEGRLAEALQLYYRAASHNPQDYALFNNLSLVALRMGDPHEVGWEQPTRVVTVSTSAQPVHCLLACGAIVVLLLC